MKKFIVDTGKKKYIVKAKDAKRAAKLVNGTVTEKNLKDSMMNDGIKECHEALGQAKDAISMIYKNYAKEQNSQYMLEKLNEASSAIARAIRHYKSWML